MRPVGSVRPLRAVQYGPYQQFSILKLLKFTDSGLSLKVRLWGLGADLQYPCKRVFFSHL